MTTTVDYGPVLGGAPADPQPAGGQVTQLQLHTSPERAGPAAYTAGPATRISTGLYRFTLDPDPAPARYYPTVTWRATAAGPTYTDASGELDLPAEDDLAVSVQEVAQRAKLPLPLTVEARSAIRDALLDAQADVEAYLGRPITPRPVTETGKVPLGWGWSLDQQPVTRVLSATPEVDPVTGAPTGTYTVTYLVGLDSRTDPTLAPVRRYVTAAALSAPALLEARHAALGPGARVVRSVSVSPESQSVSYEDVKLTETGAAGSAGAPPALSSLDRWRVAGRRVFTRR